MEASSPPSRVLEAEDRRLSFPDLRQLRAFPDLVYYLARREVAGRYAQSAVGVFWAILQPLLLATVFSVFLGHLAKVPSLPNVSYPVFAVSGMVLWLYISGSLLSASMSTVANETLISKVYFPRVIIPFTYMFPPLVDFCFAFGVVIIGMLAFGVAFHLQIFLVPLVVLVAFGVVLGAALWLSALNVTYRDVHQVIPFLVLMGMFVSPIIYPSSLVPANLVWLYDLNPVVGLMEAYRWALFATPGSSLLVMMIPVVEGVVLLITGAAYFERAERTFADVI